MLRVIRESTDRCGRASLPALVLLATAPALADAPARILFVRGADRSGGFLEAGNDAARTEQLADINNPATNGGNHGWFAFAGALRDAGFTVEQILEPLAPTDPASGPTEGAPIGFADVPLNAYDAVVLGSNNAAYGAPEVDAIESYVRRGGAVLFISDANFGGSWADAPTSDQAFLDRFGWTMQQDRGTYVLRRSDGDFLAPDHPILGGVESFDGEGVSPIVVPDSDTVPGVASTLVVRAKPGQQTRNNDRTPGPGTSRPVGPRDAALAIATVDNGRIAGHFDRNTFFNLNGAGTNLTRFDNRTYAINLIAWLTAGPGLACRADLDGDGVIDADDVVAYVTRLGDGEASADLVDPLGAPDFFDAIAYLRAVDEDACP